MSIQWRDRPARRSEVLHVRELAQNATSSEDLGQPYITPAGNQLRWIVLILMASCATSACIVAVVVVQAARHWVGLAQFGFAWLVLTLIGLGADRVLSVAWLRAQRWFR